MSHHLNGERVYVAMLLPMSDGSGEAAVLGVYETAEAAESRCWLAVHRIGYDQPTGVVPRLIGADNFDDAPEEGSLAKEIRDLAYERCGRQS